MQLNSAPLIPIVITALVVTAVYLSPNLSITKLSLIKSGIDNTQTVKTLTPTPIISGPTPTATETPTLIVTETPTPSPTSNLTPKPTMIKAAITTTPKPTSIPIVINNIPPASGFNEQSSSSNEQSSSSHKQSVQTPAGTFTVLIVSADLNSTRVIVDTASASDCSNDCPVLSLGDYVSRNGAFAGINGSFFCPASYPNCAGKTNSFDTLLMNKNKTYFNSANNIYSVVPAVIFSGNSARFVSQSLEWGRDTGVDAVIANYPLLTLNGQVVFGGNSDAKLSSRGARNFIGAKDSTVYIGSVLNATTAEAAQVLQTMGITNSLGLDQGGSTALWFGGYEQGSSLENRGYKLGPGRGIPNAILFVRK